MSEHSAYKYQFGGHLIRLVGSDFPDLPALLAYIDRYSPGNEASGHDPKDAATACYEADFLHGYAK